MEELNENSDFWRGVSDEAIVIVCAALGYSEPKRLADGRIAALAPFVFTTGLIFDIDPDGHYDSRFCYESRQEASSALASWDGVGDPPGDWVKQKGRYVERSNPKRFAGIPIVTEHAQ